MKLIVQSGGQAIKVTLPDGASDGQVFSLTVAGTEQQAQLFRTLGVLSLRDASGVERNLRLRFGASQRFEGESDIQVQLEAAVAAQVHCLQAVVRADLPGHGARSAQAGQREQVIRSQITGKVLRVMVKVGETVAAGQAVAIVEAMKMENQVFAQAPGTVLSVSIKDGDAVQTGKELVRLSP